MRNRSGLFAVLIGLAVQGAWAQGWMAEVPPAMAEVFGPGTISKEGASLYRGAFSPDGSAFYFFRKVTEGREDYRIFVSRYRDETWSEPERIHLGGDFSDLYPTLSPDGRRMVFASYRPAPGDTSARPNANLWYVDREGEGWGTPTFMAEASTLANYDSGPRFGPDGHIYFGSTTPDWRTTTKHVTRWNGRTYGPPEPDPSGVPWIDWRDDLHVWGRTYSPDSSLVVLDISPLDANGRRGPTDLWVAFRTEAGWTEPRPLAAGVNTPDAYENFVLFSPDGRTLFFARGFQAYYRVSVDAAVGTRPG